MDRKKISTYLLLIITVLVWIIIGWKIYQAIQNKPAPNNTIIKNTFEDTPSDSFSLLLSNPHPFEEQTTQAVVNTNNTEGNSNFSISIPEEEPIPISEPLEEEVKALFIYRGLVKNTQKKTGMLQIEDKIKLIREGDAVRDYKIAGLQKKQVTLVYTPTNRNYVIAFQ